MRMSVLGALSFPSGFNPNTDLTYTGSKTVIDDGGGNWRVKFLTSGTLTFTKSPGNIDLFMVGAGGSGWGQYSGGGGGGYTNTQLNQTVTVDVGYAIVIGAGAQQSNGGNTTAFGYTATGGKRPPDYNYAKSKGGDGGSGGGGYNNGAGGTNGGNGVDGANPADGIGGTGQGTTTREFAESTGTLYATGGAAANGSGGGIDGAANTGNGGGGGSNTYGGSGIVIIRNHRAA